MYLWIFSCLKELLSSEQFCKRYLYSNYSLEIEEQLSGLLRMWSDNDNWFCYWARYDEPDAWVFSDPPKRWKCGIVHLAEYELATHTDLKYKDLLRAVYILCRILKAAEPDELRLDCSKCFSQIETFVSVSFMTWGWVDWGSLRGPTLSSMEKEKSKMAWWSLKTFIHYSCQNKNSSINLIWVVVNTHASFLFLCFVKGGGGGGIIWEE